jgi:hypothetical protein
LRAIHTSAGANHSSPDISATDNDGDLNVGMISENINDVLRYALHDMTVDAVTGIASKCFSRNLEKDPRPAGGCGCHQAPMNT